MSLLCYNKGCGQRFDPDNNPGDACTFHPGVPVFHDALKGWSCCTRRTTDFSDFLSIEGCSRGIHNREKPAEPIRPEVTSSEGRREKGEELKPRDVLWRNSSWQRAASLATQGEEVKIGTSCKNGGCSKSFSGPGSNEEKCKHHPGVPNFHEGMKFWSCCRRKTSDFNCFLAQEGCTTGSHLWRKPDKNSLPELSYAEANGTTVNIRVVFEGEKEFEQKINLWGVIDVSSSVVNMMSSKMEISMGKEEPTTWARLDLPSPTETPTGGGEQKGGCIELDRENEI
ncbi:unnamed protein product [Coregonus sp. 'balchen']|nr:unnamed protein product [Coregonus sp. 'balchen']